MSSEISRADLRRQGLSDRQVQGLLDRGRLIPVRRGILLSQPPDSLDELRAVLRTHRRELVVSHLSAARLFGLPKPLGGWRRPEFTAETGSPRSRPDLRISVAQLPESQVCTRSEIRVTTAARTVVDCARALPARDALAIADAALHEKLTAAEELVEAQLGQVGWPGSARAAKLLELADGRRESPLESWSAWAFEQAGVPRPEWQLNLRSAGGQFLGRCDAWWPGVAGEADGRSKYRLAAAERGGADADVLFEILNQERLREQAFRRVHADVVRWQAAEVLSTTGARALATRILQATRSAAAGRAFTGQALP